MIFYFKSKQERDGGGGGVISTLFPTFFPGAAKVGAYIS